MRISDWSSGVCSSDLARVEIVAQSMTTDTETSFEPSMMKVIGYDMAKEAARQVYEEAGIGPDDVAVVELHDCFTANELVTYEALGLCPEGGAEKFIDDGDTRYGGTLVPNPHCGLLSTVHPSGRPVRPPRAQNPHPMPRRARNPPTPRPPH